VHRRVLREAGGGVEPETLITLRPRYGMKMTLERRGP
jgi:hypothetical protein